jgi:hypothetical protein
MEDSQAIFSYRGVDPKNGRPIDAFDLLAKQRTENLASGSRKVKFNIMVYTFIGTGLRLEAFASLD